MSVTGRAGFTLSGAPVQKKCGAFTSKKTGNLFSHHRPPLVRCQFSWNTDELFAHYSRGLPIIWYIGHAKNSPLLLWGPLFVGPLFGRTCWTCLNPPLVAGNLIGKFNGNWNENRCKYGRLHVTLAVHYLWLTNWFSCTFWCVVQAIRLITIFRTTTIDAQSQSGRRVTRRHRPNIVSI